jgi:hypothetical protein
MILTKVEKIKKTSDFVYENGLFYDLLGVSTGISSHGWKIVIRGIKKTIPRFFYL